MVIMNQQRCTVLVIMAQAVCFGCSILLLLVILGFPFHGPNQIDHYLCDAKPLLKLVCSSIHIVNILMIANSGVVVVVVFPALVVSYITILYSLRTHSSLGWQKAL